jgi:diphthine-ammonia ligase
MEKRSICSWSGGKDSCFALLQAIQSGYEPTVLLNVLNEKGSISRSHGIPAAILRAQASAAGVPIHLISSSWEDYERRFTAALIKLKEEHKVSFAIFGDIDLQAHRDWEEKVCRNASLIAMLPLWQQNRKKLVLQMLEAGLQAMIVSCNEAMGPGFLGELITPALITQLESMGIDACGENGEYHTLVLDCPLFKEGIHVHVEEKLQHGNYWFSQLALQ